MTLELPRVEQEKPEGGYIPIKAVQLFSVWWCYERRQIEFADLRLWFALQEAVARRPKDFDRRKPKYDISELVKLTGARSDAAVRRSLGRLEEAGLVRCRRSSIRFADMPKDIGDESEFHHRFNLIRNRRRRVPMPRRLLCMLAKKSRASLVATLLGHALRLLYLRQLKCRADGNCKASWIADVFGIDVRSVKRARALLVDSGILVSHGTAPWYQNRYGWRGAFNLDWSARELDQAKKLSPRPRISTETVTSKKPVSLFETKTPICDAVNGVWKPCSVLGHLTNEHLRDNDKLDSVFKQAVRYRVVCRADRINVFAAAERARRVATRNGPGLFAWLIRNRRWDYVSLADQDAAQARLRTLDAHPENSASIKGAIRAAHIQQSTKPAVESMVRASRVLLELAGVELGHAA